MDLFGLICFLPRHIASVKANPILSELRSSWDKMIGAVTAIVFLKYEDAKPLEFWALDFVIAATDAGSFDRCILGFRA